MICSKNKLGSELDTIKRIFNENGYPENVISACIREKVAILFLINGLVLKSALYI